MARRNEVTVPCAGCQKRFSPESMTVGSDHRYRCRATWCQPYQPAPPCTVCGEESDDLHPTLGRLCGAHDPRYQPGGEWHSPTPA